MVTPAEAAAYRDAQRDVVALAYAELVEWWRDLDVSDPRAAVAALEAFVPELVAAHGDIAATVAADWYDQLREQAKVSGTYRAALADSVPAGQSQATARWAAGPLFAQDPDTAKALNLLAGAVQRLVQQPGRNTLYRSGDGDPSRPRWARVPGRAKPCAFCRMLASRGAVYLSMKSAGMFNDWHRKCWCQPVPVWEGQALPYDDNAYFQEYSDARGKAGADPKAILARMREDLGIN